MANRLLVDNDVLKKLAVFHLFPPLLKAFEGKTDGVYILGAAIFVLEKAIQRSKSIKNPAAAIANLQDLVAECTKIEPSNEELVLAADLEDAGQRMSLPFDTGESLLFAILISRAQTRLITGDKRALGAVPLVCDDHLLMGMSARVACFEQTLASIMAAIGAEACGHQVCEEPLADRAAAICFGCSAGGYSAAAASAALHSYIEALRKECFPLLVPGDTLSGLFFQEDGIGIGQLGN